jgi:nitrous oxidase accessory protein NosD
MSRVHHILLMIVLGPFLIVGVSGSTRGHALLLSKGLPMLSRQEQSLCPNPEQLGFPSGKQVLRVPQDFAAIQGAIDAAPDGATIQVAAGTYIENLVIRKSLKLQADNQGHVILKGRQRGESIVQVVSSRGSGEYERLIVIIEGLTFASMFIGIELIGTPVTALIRNNVFGESSAGILSLPTPRLPSLSERTGEVYICENTFEGQGLGRGIYSVPKDLHNLYIRGNSFLKVSEGIRVEDSAVVGQGTEPLTQIWPRVEITKNKMQGITTIGILLSNSAGVVLRENIVEGDAERSLGGIVLSGSEAILEGNVVRGYQASGVEIRGSRAILKSNRLEANGISDARMLSGGVRISAGPVELVGNYIVRNLGYGILVRRVEDIIICKSNQVNSNDVGDYAIQTPLGNPQPSPELKQKCEGS